MSIKNFYFSALSALVLLAGKTAGAQTPVDTIGNIEQVSKQGNTLLIKTRQAEARVWVYSPAVIRINISKNYKADTSFAVIQQPAKTDYTETKDALTINTGKLKLVINKSPLRFYFFTPDGKPISGDDPRFGTNWLNAQVYNYRKLYPDERFIGLGEKTGNLDRRGQTYINWNTDAGFNGPNTDPLYETFPFYIGLHSGLTYGIFFDNTHKSYFDFGASNDKQMSSFGADGGDMNYYFFGAQSVAAIVEDYTWLTGRMEMPPLWSIGYQQCRYSYYTEKDLLEVAHTFRDRKIPADAIYCDIDYMDKYKIFTWNNTNFPNPKRMIDELKSINFHLVNIVDPGIKVEKGYKHYDEGIANNYFATYPNGEPYIGEAWPGRIHFPDFTNAKVRKWWGDSFNVLTDPGVEGFWNDMNEPSTWGQSIPAMVNLGKYSFAEARNVYGSAMAHATFEGTKKLLNGKRPFVLTRAAYAGVQRYSAVWTGDNSPYDAHMLLGQRLVNTLGLAGVSFTGVDIGGFSGNVTAPLMVRWNSLGVYTPMFRNHSSLETARREPWMWGTENEAIMKKDIEERYRLLPYLYSAFYQSHKTGMPVGRSLTFAYAQDANIYNEKYQNQFMFGDNILVAPVISTATTADVYLPAGQWYRTGTDSLYTGGKSYTVNAPLNNLPVFVKGGGIVAKQHVVQSTGDKGDGILELHIWNGSSGSTYTHYEDDGITYGYEKNGYYTRNITFDPVKRRLILSKSQGGFASKYTTIKLVWHGVKVNTIKVNGKKQQTAEFSNANNQIVITY